MIKNSAYTAEAVWLLLFLKTMVHIPLLCLLYQTYRCDGGGMAGGEHLPPKESEISRRDFGNISSRV